MDNDLKTAYPLNQIKPRYRIDEKKSFKYFFNFIMLFYLFLAQQVVIKPLT